VTKRTTKDVNMSFKSLPANKTKHHQTSSQHHPKIPLELEIHLGTKPIVVSLSPYK